jgi:energy-coupling factor transport system ATP-binding protein
MGSQPFLHSKDCLSHLLVFRRLLNKIISLLEEVAVSIIELQELSFQYKSSNRKALQEISFHVEEGQFTGIIGPTNAGKSTLCLVMNGIIPHLISGRLHGQVMVSGVNSLDLDAESVAKITRHVGTVFQNPESQLFGLSVEEDIAFGPENLCIPSDQINQIIDEVLHLVSLEGFRRRSPYLLSGGQKQRVAIASALAMRPEIILLDEPISELDPIGKNEVMNIVHRLNEEGRINIIVADHDPEHILNLAKKVLVIENGRILAYGNPEQVFQNISAIRASGLKIPVAAELTSQMVELGLLKKVEIREAEAIKRFKDLISRGALSLAPLRFPKRGEEDASGRPVAIDLRGVSFSYPTGQEVLHDIDLQIYENDYLALVGANGSGKTTLAKHFNGILKPKQGEIKLYGRDLLEMPTIEATRRVGYVYQNPDHQIFARTVYDEVAFGPRNLGMKGKELDDVVQEALAFVGMVGQESSEPFFLGLGQRQRLAVASVLAMQPDILVVDEPDTGQDYFSSEEMMSLIDRLQLSGKTIIIITHNMDIIARHVHRVIAMTEGRIVRDAPPRSFFDNPDPLRAISLKPPQITRFFASLGYQDTVLTIQEASKILQPQITQR